MVVSPEIDAVAVVVSVPEHYQPTRAALEAGKHVYTEWPLGALLPKPRSLLQLPGQPGCNGKGRSGHGQQI
jgi:predicted dehydrogenase